MELILEAIGKTIIYEFVLYSFCKIATKLKRKHIFPHFNYNNFGLGLLSFANLDLNVIHKSENYLILNKSFDLLINSDKPNVKVSLGSYGPIFLISKDKPKGNVLRIFGSSNLQLPIELSNSNSSKTLELQLTNTRT